MDRINKEILRKTPKKGEEDEDTFFAIYSIPSFEYWVLLHYTPTTKPYMPLDGKSVGEQVIGDLRQYIPEYKKSDKSLYKRLLGEGLLPGAKANSKRIFEASERSGNRNPSTNIHELVEYLEQIKDP